MSPNRRLVGLLAICLGLGLPVTGQPAAAQTVVAAGDRAECRADAALIRIAPDRALSFQVELADTVESRARGLMYRRDLPAGQGMLFVYPTPQPVSFWMRNTLIPLDMVFLDPEGVIRHIHRNARPLDETPVPGAAIGDPDPDRLLVLEIAGGEADRLGLQTGQTLAHPAVPADSAAWPCR
ncbi:DUF192 domain-containing protein [Paracoccus liaowanqingii]|uniref:DUF192 domain-containing protein n=1 Tax=Paracoccus liaowanqingii TaxID=2560053 RepID=A0A4Z1C0Y1_9RHOB|nr:DUF192 domain-containing protein [Paracoccus liaowanqingii]TGN62116.1 DUF192 domain-containing protein [Paracoccus liaowanqingii]